MSNIYEQPPGVPNFEEDSAHASRDRGIQALAVRQDVLAATSDDGDYTVLKVDANGRLYVTVDAVVNITGDESDLNSTTPPIDNHETFAVGLPGPGGHVVGGTAANPFRQDPTGTTPQPVGPTVVPGTGAANLGKLEDAPHADADVGVLLLAVRNDAEGSNVDTDGDNEAPQTDDRGNLRTTPRARRGVLTNRSGTIAVGSVSQPLAVANLNRQYFFFQNVSNRDQWIDFGVAATESQPSIKVPPDASYVMEGNFISTEAINVIGPTAGREFTAKEA